MSGWEPGREYRAGDVVLAPTLPPPWWRRLLAWLTRRELPKRARYVAKEQPRE